MVAAESKVKIQRTRTFGVKKKIVLLGDPAVGKTSLITRFVLDAFSDRYISTIGTKVTKKTVDIDVPEKEATASLTLMVWDVLGQKELKEFHPLYLQGAEGALIIADYTREETARSIVEWHKMVTATCGKVPAAVLVNKCDLKGDTEDPAFIKPYADAIGASFMFTSAKTGRNVEDAFTRLGTTLVRKAAGLE